MPRRKTSYKKKKVFRRTYASKKKSARRRNNPTVMRVRTPQIVADRAFVRLKYNEIIALTGITYDASYTFTGNGLFDPNITSTGTQPTGFDQYMGLYTQYRVHGSKIKIKASNVTTGSSVILAVMPCIDYAGVQSGGINEIVRDARSKYNMLGAGQQQIGMVKSYCSSKKALGEKELDDIVYSGSASGNPSNQWYWAIVAANVSGSGTLSIQMHVELTYYVEFYKRKDLDIS